MAPGSGAYYLGCSSALYRALQQGWTLPSYTLDSLLQEAPFSLLFTEPPKSKTPVRIGLYRETSLLTENRLTLNAGILGPSVEDYRCVWTYETSTRTLFAFVGAKQGTESPIINWLRKAPETIYHPGVLILLVCEDILDIVIRTRLWRYHENLISDAGRLGFRYTGQYGGVDEKHLTQGIQNLTETLDGIAFFVYILEHLETTTNVLDEFNEHLRPHVSSGPCAEGVEGELSQRIIALRARIKASRACARLLWEEAQVILQTV